MSTQSTTKDAGSNMTAIAEYTPTAAGLAELRQKHQGVVYDVTVPKEMKAAKEARAELRTLRTDLEKKRVEIKAPALERCRLIDEEAKRLTAEIRALEEPIDVQIKAEEARAEAEKLAKLEAERQRVESIARAIEDIRNVPAGLIGKPAVIIEGQLAKLREQPFVPEFFAERTREAEDALAATISRVEQQLQAQRDHEAEQKRVAAERAELERLRAEAEARRRADEEKAAAERAERQRQEEEARAEREAQERAEREAREAELAAERERQAAEQKRLDEQRAELERQRKAAEAKAERERLANLGLREAAQAVVDHFHGKPRPAVIDDLIAALANDAAKAAPARGKRSAAA